MKIENIQDLRVLIQTASTGSLSKAATVLGLTPAATSAALKRLETQLGVRLFERSTRAMRLTSAGATLLDYASRAYELIAEGETQVSEDSASLIGLIRVSAPSDLTRAILLPWFDEFLAHHSGIQLDLSVGDRRLDIIQDELDLAIRYGVLNDSRLVARALYNAEPMVAASPEYLYKYGEPKTPLDLTKHNCLIYDRAGRSHRVWRFCKDNQWIDVPVKGDRSTDDASLARQWAIQGAGILLKSPMEQREDLVTGRLIRVLKQWNTDAYPLHAVLPSGRFIPKRVRSLVDFLVSKFQSVEVS